MTSLKKYLLPYCLITLLLGCAGSSDTLNINPNIVLPKQDPSLTGLSLSISSADLRQDKALAKINRDNQLVVLQPSRDMRFLMQEVLERQMAARGYMIGKNNGVPVQVVVNTLSATVQEGNFRFKINSKADISVSVQLNNGSKTQVKNYRSSFNVEGPFAATNQKVADAVTQVLNSVIEEMANDITIHEFIKQNSRR